MNSCLMMGLTLWTGIDLWAVFKDEDLIGPGIERDSHLTVLYAEGKEIPKEGLSETLKTLLGDNEWKDLLKEFRSQNPLPVVDHFSLGTFEGEGQDYLVLRLQPESPLYDTLHILHTGLKGKFKVTPKFPDYKPHVTLATLEKGKAKDYMFNPTLGLVLEKATFTSDDFILSYGETGEPDDRKRYQITTENAVTRFFRQLRAEKDKDYYDSL